MRVLHVEDDLRVQRVLGRVLVHGGLHVEAVNTKSAAVAALEQERFDSVVVDLRLGEPGHPRSGLEIVRVATTHGHKSVVFTGTSERHDVLSALTSGAVGCLPKGRCAPERVLETLQTNARVARGGAPDALSAIIGHSERIAGVRTLISKFAGLSHIVLVTGEQGTGKELVARALHSCSGRRGEFVAVNCAAVAESLFEAELFGHEKGSFTGADRQREGKFAQAEEGTLFLDEFGELGLPQQAALLRVFQERKFTPLGGRERPTSARIVVATNRNLEAEVANRTFRPDLLSRITALSIVTPPLAERTEDIAQIAQHCAFCEGVMLTDASLVWLKAQRYPANVRSLQHLIIRAAAVADTAVLEPSDFIHACSVSTFTAPKEQADGLASFDDEVERTKRSLIDAALARTGGNQTTAAQQLKMPRHRLVRYLAAQRKKA